MTAENTRAEAQELGWMLIEGRTNACAFESREHALIYAAMVFVEFNKRVLDIVTVAETLAHWWAVEAVGGVSYLASLTEGLPRRRPGALGASRGPK